MTDARAQIAASLAGWLAAHGHGARVESLERTMGGHSQETWLVGADVDGQAADLVLRLPTPLSGPRAIVAQRRALAAVADRGVLAPRLLWWDETSDNPFARPFIVMERIHGDIPQGWHELPEGERRVVAREAIEVLARLHAIEVDGAPLDVDPSPLMSLDGLAKLLERVAPLPPVLSAGLWWLARHEPPPARRTIVHGDFRMGNMVVANGHLAGVLDWEMAAPGDPLVDLAWCFVPRHALPDVDEQPLVDLYAGLSGIAIEPEHLRWHRALGYARLAYYTLSGLRGFDRERSDDLRLAAFRLQVPVYLDRLAATIAGEPVT